MNLLNNEYKIESEENRVIILSFFSKRNKCNFHSSKRDQKLHSVIHSVSEFPSPITIGTIDKTL